MVLAPNEKIIKEWHYGYTKTKKEQIDCALTVTDKRVIASHRGKLTNATQEVRTKDIYGVSASNIRQSIAPGVRCILYGIVFFIIFLAFTMAGDTAEYATPFLLIGGAWVVLGILIILLSGSNVQLYLYTNAIENPGLVISQSSFVRKKGKNTKIKIKVNKSVADEMVSTIGSLLLTSDNNRSFPG